MHIFFFEQTAATQNHGANHCRMSHRIFYSHNQNIELLLTTDNGFRVRVVDAHGSRELALRSTKSLLIVTRQIENYTSGGVAVACNLRTAHQQWLTDMTPSRRLIARRSLYPLTAGALRRMQCGGAKLHEPTSARPDDVCAWEPSEIRHGSSSVTPVAPVRGIPCQCCSAEVTYDVSSDAFVCVTGVRCRHCDTTLCGACHRNNGWRCRCGRSVSAVDREAIASCCGDKNKDY